MSRLFVRERRQVGVGAGEPRFRIVASEGMDLRVYVPHMRRMELEQLAAATGCELVYLPRGEQSEGEGEGHRHGSGEGGGHGRGQGRQGQQMQSQD